MSLDNEKLVRTGVAKSNNECLFGPETHRTWRTRCVGKDNRSIAADHPPELDQGEETRRKGINRVGPLLGLSATAGTLHAVSVPLQIQPWWFCRIGKVVALGSRREKTEEIRINKFT